MNRKLFWLLIILLISYESSRVNADVLVTRDGSHIETEGPWKVAGRQLIFTTPEGRLSSIRLSEVDLDASELATNPPPPPPVVPPPPPPPAFPPPRPELIKEPVMIVTHDSMNQGGWLERFFEALLVELEDIEDFNGPGAEYFRPEVEDEVRERIDTVKSLVLDTCSEYQTLNGELTSKAQLDPFEAELEACKAKLSDPENNRLTSYGYWSRYWWHRGFRTTALKELENVLEEIAEDPDGFWRRYGNEIE